MARKKATLWQRSKYWLSGLLLILPAYFLYQQLNPSFPAAFEQHQVGPFHITPAPYNLDAPYAHHEEYVKDFMLLFAPGEIAKIRQGYVNIGTHPLPLEQLQQGDSGIMHGSRHSQEAHAIAPAKLTPEQSLWVTIETWSGEVYVGQWPLAGTELLK